MILIQKSEFDNPSNVKTASILQFINGLQENKTNLGNSNSSSKISTKTKLKSRGLLSHLKPAQVEISGNDGNIRSIMRMDKSLLYNKASYPKHSKRQY